MGHHDHEFLEISLSEYIGSSKDYLWPHVAHQDLAIYYVF